MDFIAKDLDKYNVWDVFMRPVPVKTQMYVKIANWSPGEEIDCESENPDDACLENDQQPSQQGIGQALPSFGGESADPGTGYQESEAEPGDGFG